MLAVLAAATEDSKDNTAVWVTLAGAIVVAGIAAVTAQIRQRAQLRHDRELEDVAEARA
jgi:hypothetical protein